mmetsp:Transcript_12059/g.24036  ORF Transcript_12059/g.24036 Transcript_12059/m.24036 type:complete len:200 (-) Transcript_12059:228-827(-)
MPRDGVFRFIMKDGERLIQPLITVPKDSESARSGAPSLGVMVDILDKAPSEPRLRRGERFGASNPLVQREIMLFPLLCRPDLRLCKAHNRLSSSVSCSLSFGALESCLHISRNFSRSVDRQSTDLSFDRSLFDIGEPQGAAWETVSHGRSMDSGCAKRNPGFFLAPGDAHTWVPGTGPSSNARVEVEECSAIVPLSTQP